MKNMAIRIEKLAEMYGVKKPFFVDIVGDQIVFTEVDRPVAKAVAARIDRMYEEDDRP